MPKWLSNPKWLISTYTIAVVWQYGTGKHMTTLNWFFYFQNSPSAYQTWRRRTEEALKINKWAIIKVSKDKSITKPGCSLPLNCLSIKPALSNMLSYMSGNSSIIQKVKRTTQYWRHRYWSHKVLLTLNIWGINIKKFKCMLTCNKFA